MASNLYYNYGPPGCGKTTSLEKHAREAVEEHGSDGVVLTSLTNAAANEIKSRGIEIKTGQVGTLHSLAKRSLGKNIKVVQAKGFNEEFPEYKLTTVENGIDSEGSKENIQGRTKGDQLLARLNIYRSSLIPQNAWPSNIKKFSQIWFDYLKKTETVDFVMMIELAIKNSWAAPGTPRALIGDEAQDWSKLEAKLFRDCWGDRAETVIMAGDPDQAIYEWRGADPNIFMEHSIPLDHKNFLRQSYRLPKYPHRYARKLIQRIKNREDVEFSPTSHKGTVERFRANVKNPARLIPIIQKELKNERSVMILASCAFMLTETIDALKKEGIPFHNPYRTTNAAWNPLARKDKHTMPVDRVASFLKPDERLGKFAREWKTKDFIKWAAWLRSGDILARNVKSIMTEEYFSFPDEFEPFAKLFSKEEHANEALQLNLEWYLNSVGNKERNKIKFPIAVAEKQGPLALYTKPGVCIGTIHSVKGSEAETVIVFPDVSTKMYQEKRKDISADPETIRQFYVGVTRTKDRLILCDAASFGAFRW